MAYSNQNKNNEVFIIRKSKFLILSSLSDNKGNSYLIVYLSKTLIKYPLFTKGFKPSDRFEIDQSKRHTKAEKYC